MLPPEHKDQLISSSIAFMQAVAEAYGPEQGITLWTTIADTVDPDLRGEVFMAMLTGNFRHDKITVKTMNSAGVVNKVALIRCIRNHDRRRLSLKEAKDISDLVDAGQQQVLEVDPEYRGVFVKELRDLGLVV